jgi:hypothetical protein
VLPIRQPGIGLRRAAFSRIATVKRTGRVAGSFALNANVAAADVDLGGGALVIVTVSAGLPSALEPKQGAAMPLASAATALPRRAGPLPPSMPTVPVSAQGSNILKQRRRRARI